MSKHCTNHPQVFNKENCYDRFPNMLASEAGAEQAVAEVTKTARKGPPGLLSRMYYRHQRIFPVCICELVWILSLYSLGTRWHWSPVIVSGRSQKFPRSILLLFKGDNKVLA